MTDTLEDELTAILEALDILGPDAFRFAGGPIQHLPQPGALADALISTLYTHCYAHRFPGPPAISPHAPDPLHAAQLDVANANKDHWDMGWRVFGVEPDGTLGVAKGERQRRVRPGEYLATNGRGTAPRIGEVVSLWMTRGSHTLQTAFQFMYGAAPTDVWDEYALTRVYFNVSAAGASALVRLLTERLNLYQVPYRMKALTDATHYTRADSVVLYMARRHAAFVARLLAGFSKAECADLADPTPLFTRRFRAGMGFAEDPGNGDSFGIHRCRLVAEAALAAHAAGQRMAAEKLEAVRARFKTHGLDLERPWVSPGRTDIYSAFDATRLAQ